MRFQNAPCLFFLEIIVQRTHNSFFCVRKVVQPHKNKYSYPCPPTKEVSCYSIVALIVGQKLEIKISPETKTLFRVDGAKPTP
jgi:hypothetical protein